MGRTCYDDNYGEMEIESEEDLEFYHDLQTESVWKKCKGCGRRVHIKPSYGYCNSCANKLEHGMDLCPDP